MNALPTLCFDRARQHADRADEEADRRTRPARRHADPDQGSGRRSRACARRKARRSSRTSIPEKSDILVEHLEAEGGIVYAMSNTPEFGAGANTFNEVFGATRNPWNTSRSAAGSSGGAAVALATGMAWLAHGSDMGGSLRNPASFNGIVGFRPSIGRVAHTPDGAVDQNLGQQGPMARNVEDVALLLDAMSGEDPRDPLVAAAHRRVVSRRGALELAAEARRVVGGPRHHQGRQRSGGDHRQGRAALRRTRRVGGGGASRSDRAARVLPDAARLRLLHEAGRNCCAAIATCSSPR